MPLKYSAFISVPFSPVHAMSLAEPSLVTCDSPPTVHMAHDSLAYLGAANVTHSSILARKPPWTEAPGRLHTAHGVAESDTVSKEASCSPTTFQRGVHQLYQRSSRSPPLHCVILACRKALIKLRYIIFFSYISFSLSVLSAKSPQLCIPRT